MKATRLPAVFFFFLVLSAAQKTTTYVAHYLEPFPGPQVYRDPNSNTLLYVESDGRHVAAISPAGKIVWNRDPYSEAHLEHYRTDKPQIVYIGPAPDWFYRAVGGRPKQFVGLNFNNSQSGALNISDGSFKYLGQD